MLGASGLGGSRNVRTWAPLRVTLATSTASCKSSRPTCTIVQKNQKRRPCRHRWRADVDPDHCADPGTLWSDRHFDRCAWCRDARLCRRPRHSAEPLARPRKRVRVRADHGLSCEM